MSTKAPPKPRAPKPPRYVLLEVHKGDDDWDQAMTLLDLLKQELHSLGLKAVKIEEPK